MLFSQIVMKLSFSRRKKPGNNEKYVLVSVFIFISIFIINYIKDYK